MSKNNWVKFVVLFVLVSVISTWIDRHGYALGQDCQQPASVPACTGDDATICSGCAPNQFCCPKSSPGGCNDSFEDLCKFTTCMSDPGSICLIPSPTPTPTPSPTPTPTPSPSSANHKITFTNKCGTESIWIAAYNGFNGDAPLLCDASSAGKAATGNCSRNRAGGLPPPWGSDGSPTWEIPAGESRGLTIPFCYTSADFAARTGCTVNGPSLECTGGDCGGFNNCGTDGTQPQPVTLAEFTFDGGEPNCNGLDNYDVSAVAGFNLRVTITPDNQDCIIAGGQCKSLDGVCPYNLVLWNPMTNQWDIRKDTDTHLGTCLSPGTMAAFPGVPPFTNFTADEQARLGCNPAPYNISPVQPAGNCFSTFGKGGTCTLSACGLSAPYQFCDPYGECDAATGRTAVWPSFTDPITMTQKPSTIYIENIQKACGNNTNGGGIYAWAFDDNNSPPGLSGGLYTCPKSAPPISGQDYTVTFWCDGDKDNDGVTNENDFDSDNDGIPNTEESASTEMNSQRGSVSLQREIPDDPDGDRLPNELDLDSDGDCICDILEGGGLDEDRDCVVDNFADSDEDGLNDAQDPDQGGVALPLTDTDNDEAPDFVDSDSDNDGVTDANETMGGLDVDGDGVQDDSEDLNGDGVADSCHPATGTPVEFLDSDGDGIFDHLDSNDNTPQGGGGCSIALTGVKPSIPVYLLIPVFIVIRRVWGRY